jgi:hypothetical protein
MEYLAGQFVPKSSRIEVPRSRNSPGALCMWQTRGPGAMSPGKRGEAAGL